MNRTKYGNWSLHNQDNTTLFLIPVARRTIQLEQTQKFYNVSFQEMNDLNVKFNNISEFNDNTLIYIRSQ